MFKFFRGTPEMINNRIIAILLVIGTGIASKIEAQSTFALPLRIEAPGVYTRVRLDGSGMESRTNAVYEREKSANLEGEIRFLQNFSFRAGVTGTKWDKTDSATITEKGRVNVGLKYAQEYNLGWGAFTWGLGIRGFNRQTEKLKREDISPEMYLVRPHAGAGLKIGFFEIATELRLQSETNSSFKEKPNEEFRRYYQAGISVSYGITENLRLYAESEYRTPYNKKIDDNAKFWNIYPGVSYQIYQKGFLSVSMQYPMIREREADRGIRVSYFHLFDF